MEQHVYKLIEVTGTSPTGIEEAVQVAVARASETVVRLRWFEVTDLRGRIEGGAVVEWQVGVKIGFRLGE